MKETIKFLEEIFDVSIAFVKQKGDMFYFFNKDKEIVLEFSKEELKTK